MPISVSSGHFALRYEVPKFLARGGHLCMAVLTIAVIGRFDRWLDLYLGPFLARNGHLCNAMVQALTRLCYGYMPPRQRPHLGQHSKNVPLSLTSPYALGKLLLFSDLHVGT